MEEKEKKERIKKEKKMEKKEYVCNRKKRKSETVNIREVKTDI